MLHSLKVTLRFLKRYSGFTLINLFGLSVGMAVCFMILNYVIHELSFDQFHGKEDRIYRVVVKTQSGGREISAPFTIGNLSTESHRQIAGIEESVRLYSFGGWEIKMKDGRKFTDNIGIYADSSFFQIFDYRLVSGIRNKILDDPNSVVLTESVARKIFGEEDPYMKTLVMDGNHFTVTGVMQDLPVNTHFRFDMIASFSTICNPDYDITTRDGVSFPTYVLLAKNAHPGCIAHRIDSLTRSMASELFGDYSFELDSWLQPLDDIHLKSGFT